jgi:hypothetical protein
VCSKRRTQALAVGVVMTLLTACASPKALAQSTRRNRRLSVLQQQNALLQQQNAVLTAVQQTNALVQSASQQNSAPPQGPVANLLAFQQQQSALAIALQQTNALLQVSYRQNSALSETALRQLNTLQTAQQQTINLQGALLAQNGQLTPYQLTQLLTSQPPPSMRSAARR